MIDINALLEAATYEDGDQTFVVLHDAVAKAIDPRAFERIDPDVLIMDDEDREWLYGKADRVINALNELGFLTLPNVGV